MKYLKKSIFIHGRFMILTLLTIATITVLFASPVGATNELEDLVYYEIKLSANPLNGGFLSGDGIYEEGAEINLVAEASNGYYFTGWVENGELISAEDEVSFIVTGDRDLVAGFEDDGIIEVYPSDIEAQSSQIENAISWAMARKGQYIHKYNGLCHKFVRHAYLYGGGINTDNYGTSAIWVYNNYKSVVDNNRNKSHVPPRGTMVLYRSGSTPHTALSLGNGQVINSNVGNIKEEGYLSFTTYGYTYLGWISVTGSTPPPPSDPFKAWPSKSEYLTTENVKINWNTHPSTVVYSLKITNTKTGKVEHNDNHGLNTSFTAGKLPAGDYSFYARAWQGWNGPYVDSPTRTFTVKTASPPTGSMRVTIEPSDARSAGAQWRLTGGPDTGWKNSGATISSIPTGSYTVTYKDVSGWNRPSNSSVTISSGSTATMSGTYTRQTGSLKVTIEPSDARSAGAQWRLTGGPDTGWKNSGATISNIPIGSYTVTFNNIDHWDKPVDATVTISNGQTTDDTGKYSHHTGSLVVRIRPESARNAGAKWSLDDGNNWFDGGEYEAKEVKTGTYTIVFKDISNWNSPNTVQLKVENNKTTSHDAYYSLYNYTQSINELNIGDRVVDNSWNWKFKTGKNYYSNEGDVTKPITWIIASKEHYGSGSGITLISEELIGFYTYDNSTNRGSILGSNHWGDSGSNNAKNGLRTWLNSTGNYSGTGFFNAFSESFKKSMISINLPNREWQYGSGYFTKDKVFIPAFAELSNEYSSNTYTIGKIYSYFANNSNELHATIGNNKQAYWTRSPANYNVSEILYITEDGKSEYVNANHDDFIAVRPALNISLETLVSVVPNEQKVYEFISDHESDPPVPDPGTEQYTISVSAEPEAGGNIIGGGTFDEGKEVTVEAVANHGYGFVNWTEGGSEVSTDSTNTFIVTEDRDLVANFASVEAENTLGDLQIGDRVVDPSWEWEHRTDNDYSGTGETKPVTWIVVAKNHYGAGSGVTLLAEELIGRHVFDNSTDRGSNYGSNHWGDSGTTNAIRGLRPWLNSSGMHSGEGFYRAFSAAFQAAVVQVTIPNKEWQAGGAYITQDQVFTPSTTELGDTRSWIYEIGTVYPFFSGASDADRIAQLGGANTWYRTRSPDSHYGYSVRGVRSDGGFYYGDSAYDDYGGVRPALNLKSEILVSEIKNADGVYELFTTTQHRSSAALYASFADAVYAYDNYDWLPTPVTHVPSLALAAHEDNLYGAYGDGIYTYNGISWNPNRITPGVASNLASHNGLLLGSFGDATYTYDGTSWIPFTSPTSALASYQGYLYASFADAVYAYDGNAWIDLPVGHVPALALAAHEGHLYGAFEDGVYVYDGTSWDPEKITPGVASNLVSFNGELYGSFADGTYAYDGNQWSLFTGPTNALAAY